MHKSKLSGFIIDCETPDLDAAARFWSTALGLERKELPPADAGRYIGLADPTGTLDIEVQSVSHPSRVHLDIETDDIEAEVRRLEVLGATRVAQVRDWWVMQAPTGHRFCVVQASTPNFAALAKTWPGSA